MQIVRSRLPIFFHRRLLLVVVVGLAPMVLLGARLTQLTVVEGAQLRSQAEKAARRTRYLPTLRGTILDRNGEVLAQDQASWSLGVPFEVIAGIWAVDQAEREARLELGEDWDVLEAEQQGEAILQRLPFWDALIEDFFQTVARETGMDPQRLEEERDRVHARISRMSVRVMQSQRAAFETRKAADSDRILGVFRPRPIAEQVQPHVLVRNLDDDIAYRIERLADQRLAEAARRLGGRMPAPLVELIDRPRRDHPWLNQPVQVQIDRSHFPEPLASDRLAEVTIQGVADHITGSVRGVQEADLLRRPFVDDPLSGKRDLGGYRAGKDQIGSRMVGSRGIEAAFEELLRGTLGVKATNLETDEVDLEPARPGRDLDLTLDISLQARIQALLDPTLGLTRVQQYHYGWKGSTPIATKLPLGTPLDGSVVVLDIETGELLAMASNPSFNQGLEMPVSERANRAALMNRAVEATYPPGSLVKPLLYVAAATDGVIGAQETITCNGHYLPGKPGQLRCWIFRERYNMATHGPLGIKDALMRSCNIYFYTLADRIGNDRLVGWFHGFGLDEPLGTGLLHEREGRLVGEAGGNVPERTGSLAMLGIGQAELTWSPVQAANAYATMVRNGVIGDARLVRDPSLLGSRRTGSLSLDPEACKAVLEGMRRVVEEPSGTGRWLRYPDARKERIFNIPGITLWGKSGTAQAPPRRIDGDGDGAFDGPADRLVSGLSHAWFLGLVGNEGDERPRYVIVSLLEHGESGGRASGPIVSEVIRLLIEENYLEGAAGSDG
jgi:cell division protein FtsI/penicillin-binding protein 2